MMIKRLLVALDGSDHAQKALELASEVASRFDAELIAMHVIPDNRCPQPSAGWLRFEFPSVVAESFDLTRFADARDDPQLMSRHLAEQAAETGRRFRFALGDRLLDNASRHARERGAQNLRRILREGDPANEILDLAGQEQVDTIVLGRCGLGDVAGLLLGSVSHKVTHIAKCACLTVR